MSDHTDTAAARKQIELAAVASDNREVLAEIMLKYGKYQTDEATQYVLKILRGDTKK